ncbi:MAG: branched-chain amino acid ABC transporter substrate-binding protein [Actinomycetota bacterium]
MRRRFSLVAVSLVLALVGAACAKTADKPGTEKKTTVKIAILGPQTGPVGPLFVHAIRAAQLAIDAANASGEVEGINIEYEIFDSQGSPDQATTLKDKFIPDEQFIGLVGPGFSGETRAILPSLQEAGLVMISPSATNTKLPSIVCGGEGADCPAQTVFHRVVPDDDVQGKGVADYVTKVLKLSKLAYAHDNTDYGKAVAEGTRDLLKAAGVAEVVTVAIDPASQDYSAAVNQLKGAEGVFYGGYAPEAGRLAKQLKDGGFKGKYLSGDGSLDQTFVSAAGGAGAEGAFLTCACKLATTETPGELGEFAKDYKAKFKLDAGVYAGEGYDSARIFIEGLKKGHITRKAMHDYVESLTTVPGGISKTIEFLPNGNQKPTAVFVHEIKGGKIVVLGTVEELTK